MKKDKVEKIEMTPEDLKEFQEFKEEKKRKVELAAIEKRKEDYKVMVEASIYNAYERLILVAQNLKDIKQKVLADFTNAIAMKQEIFGVKTDQRSHTFTNEEGTKRITVGNYTNDAYRDTVNEGIEIVKQVVLSLARDEESRALVDGILKLMSKDKSGALKASKVVQLRQMAEKLKNARLLDGVRIIEESYQPQVSKIFIRCEYKDENNQWLSLPLGITEA